MPVFTTKKDEILFHISKRPKQGFTDAEIEEKTGYTHQSVSASRRHLVIQGEVKDSGVKRTNQFGNDCIVWVPTKE